MAVDRLQLPPGEEVLIDIKPHWSFLSAPLVRYRDAPAAGVRAEGLDAKAQRTVVLADFLASRGHDPKLAPLYAQMLVGMVAFTGQWWLDARKPKLEEVAANLIDLAWNGLSHLDANGRESARR